MPIYKLIWSPSGQEIARVKAATPGEALRKAPMPYRRYKGEVYAQELTLNDIRTEMERQADKEGREY